MGLLNPFSDAFGLDISDRSFKLVQLQRGRGTGKFRIIGWNTVDVPEGVIEKGDIKDMNAAASRLEKLLKDVNGRRIGSAVVACLPEAKTFIKITETDRDASEADLRKAVVDEIERNIPLPLDEIYYDWQEIAEPVVAVAKPVPKVEALPGVEAVPEEPVTAIELPRKRVLVGATPKTLSDEYAALIERAGLMPIALEIEATAITRAVIPNGGLQDEAVGILDIGGTRSSLVIYDSGALQMSISIPISGQAITSLISESLSVSLDDAELLKRECGLDELRCEDKMWKILQTLIDDMTEKIRNALRFYKIGFPQGKKIERLYLCGGGAQFREIDNVLSRKLTIQVKSSDTLVNIDPALPKGFPSGPESLGYATAIGLAMRAADEYISFKGA